jgi:hypothetical protein
LPLYTGTILAVRQDAGGAEAIALSLRKFARLSTPALPRNFSNCGGSELPPLLLVALYLYYSTFFSSSVVIKLADGDASG